MPATFPTTGNAEVTVTRRRKQAVVESEFGTNKYVQDWQASSWIVKVRTPPMKEGDPNIATWIQFFEDCNGMVNTFTMDISRYVVGQSGLTALTMRMTKPNKSWSMDKRKVFGPFEFEAQSE
jgi:hypothetical protein